MDMSFLRNVYKENPRRIFLNLVCFETPFSSDFDFPFPFSVKARQVTWLAEDGWPATVGINNLHENISPNSANKRHRLSNVKCLFLAMRFQRKFQYIGNYTAIFCFWYDQFCKFREPTHGGASLRPELDHKIRVYDFIRFCLQMTIVKLFKKGKIRQSVSCAREVWTETADRVSTFLRDRS